MKPVEIEKEISREIFMREREKEKNGVAITISRKSRPGRSFIGIEDGLK